MREGEMLISGGGKIDEMHLVTILTSTGSSVEIEVRLTIDTHNVAEALGRQAYWNRSHKSHDCGGLVRVRLEKVR